MGTYRGQVATMLTLFIGLLLVLAMVTVNVGKVAMTRTHTSDAGDAGTLAAGSFIASGDNAINDINYQMKLAYTAWLDLHEPGGGPGNVPYQDFLDGWIALTALYFGELTRYLQAVETGKQAESAAEDALRRFAYLNGGIDDPHPDAFSDFLKDKDLSDNNEYKWTDRQWSAPDAGTKEVENKFQIEASDIPVPSPTPIPMPARFGYCQAPWYPCGPWLCCIVLVDGIATAPAPVVMLLVNSSMVMDGTGEVWATTRRIEPDANLRLWTMRYRDPTSTTSDQDGIISTSRCSYGGGSTVLWPAPDKPYDDVHLKKVPEGG